LISAKFFLGQISNQFVCKLAISLKSSACKNDHFVFNVENPSLEARNIRLVNRITCICDQGIKIDFRNKPPNMSFIVKFG